MKQSTKPIELTMDIDKYVHNRNICNPEQHNNTNYISLIDIESSLWGIDRISSDCDEYQYPYCEKNGCLVTGDNRIPPHTVVYACDRGYEGDNAVITTNMKNASNLDYYPNN